METKKFNIYLIIILIIILIGAGIVYFAFLKKGEESASNKTSEEIEIAAIKAGKTKMTGGQVINVDYDADRFVLLILRPSGEYKEYTIHINQNTEFLFLFEQMETIGEGEEEEIKVTTKENPASFNDLEKNNNVSVYFENRVDLDTDSLTAKTIKIIKEIESESEPE